MQRTVESLTHLPAVGLEQPAGLPVHQVEAGGVQPGRSPPRRPAPALAPLPGRAEQGEVGEDHQHPVAAKVGSQAGQRWLLTVPHLRSSVTVLVRYTYPQLQKLQKMLIHTMYFLPR